VSASDDTGQVRIDRRGSRCDMVIVNPARRNALTSAMIASMIAAVDDASRDDEVRVITITSDGADFCTGIDLVESNRAEERPRTGHLSRRMHQSAHRLVRAIHEAPLPVVCGVSGWAIGIGNALALSGDVVIADDSARFWVPFVGRGFTPDSANSYLLPRLVGMMRAKEMVLRAKPIDAARAQSWGLVSDVVAGGALARAVDAVATEFAEAATIAVGLAKELLHRNVDADLTGALRNEAIYEELAVRTDDFKEGIRAFGEKRPARFTGR